MRSLGTARRLTIIVGEYDTWQHKNVASEIVRRAHAAGIAGASVFRGLESYGRSGAVHTTRILSFADDLPMQIVIVDNPGVIDTFLSQLDELGIEGIIMIDDVELFGSDRE